MDAISIQMYSLRLVDGLGAQLDLAQRAGYRHVELIGSHLDDAVAVRAALDARGLTASSAHIGLAALRSRPTAVLEACGALGLHQLFMPSVPPEERDGPAGYWSALGAELGAMAVSFASQGVELGYHNHHWELQTKDGGHTALDLLFAGAEGTPLRWQADVAWLVRGGGDPAQLISAHSDRVTSAHAKDLAPAGDLLDEDGWADVGAGVLDWTQLAPLCLGAGARWLVAEHDKPSDPERFALRSHRFLSAL